MRRRRALRDRLQTLGADIRELEEWDGTAPLRVRPDPRCPEEKKAEVHALAMLGPLERGRWPRILRSRELRAAARPHPSRTQPKATRMRWST
jgi:hypothetical protein